MKGRCEKLGKVGIHPEGNVRGRRKWARKKFRQGRGMIGRTRKGHSGGSVENRLEEGEIEEINV